jgi:hypothetical protein
MERLQRVARAFDETRRITHSFPGHAAPAIAAKESVSLS